MTLKEQKWEEFEIGTIFYVDKTQEYPVSKLLKSGKVPRISCSAFNNGVEGFYANSPNEKGGCLTIDSGTNGFVAYQEADFLGSEHVEKIYNSKPIPRERGLFYQCEILHATKNKYNYGYKFGCKRIKGQKILLPVIRKYVVDEEFMENYISKKMQDMFLKYQQFIMNKMDDMSLQETSSLNEKKWECFRICDVFQCSKGKVISIKKLEAGDVPLITAHIGGNGVHGFADTNPLFQGNQITVEKIRLKSYYQPGRFACTGDVNVLFNEKINEFSSLFIATMIMKNSKKYCYGRQAQLSVLKREKILLPVDEAGIPDYYYMEQYIKNMMQKKYKKYLDFKNK